MKIISFLASNFKKLTAVEINPEGNVITLTGDNGAGKSSILDGIEATLAGKDSVGVKPIRDGASRGQTVTKLSNGFVITRTYTPGGSTLKIEHGEEKIASPQAVLDKLIGALTFDPLSFSRMKPAEQSETLRKLGGIDFSELDKEKKRLYDLRTEINRDKERDAARLAGMKMFGKGVPDLPTPIESVVAEINAARAQNQKADDAVLAAAKATSLLQQAELEVQEAMKQIASWQEVLKVRQEGVTLRQAAVKSCDEAVKQTQRVNTSELDAKLIGLEASNARVREKQARLACEADVKAAADKSASITREIEAIEQKKADLLRKAKFPLEGLTFDDGGVFFAGQPFSEISDGEKLRVSVAIGMALNPTLRVIFVRDGSLLDKSGLKLIATMAAEKGYQVWMEDARSTDPAALLIEDGQVVETSSNPQFPPATHPSGLSGEHDVVLDAIQKECLHGA